MPSRKLTGHALDPTDTAPPPDPTAVSIEFTDIGDLVPEFEPGDEVQFVVLHDWERVVFTVVLEAGGG